jgi:hypothetical protein
MKSIKGLKRKVNSSFERKGRIILVHDELYDYIGKEVTFDIVNIQEV